LTIGVAPPWNRRSRAPLAASTFLRVVLAASKRQSESHQNHSSAISVTPALPSTDAVRASLVPC